MRRETFDAFGAVFVLFLAFAIAGVTVAWTITRAVECVARAVLGGY